ncbi:MULTISPECIES: HAMP domain-containing histidine kinase [unclassified Colwellia]|jgi:hypothetical protein|nr:MULTISPECIES: HAMP domain-containing histidine kinase [unclassified Colwellia]MBA6252138.1 HAMP domain-containing histidine kinase [Colwellia sp. MB3u-55]MBA6399756.1 HAMP domain-containing histidine kinase [Colwellia sp. BRX10-4]
MELALVKRIIENMAFLYGVSDGEVGATFCFTLP